MSDVYDTLKKMGLLGVGILTLTQEKLEELTQEMIKKGEISREEGKKFVKEILSEREKQLKDIQDKIGETLKETLKKGGIVTKSDIEALERKIGKLEKAIQSMSKK